MNRREFHHIPAIYSNADTHLPIWTKAYNWKQQTEVFQHNDIANVYYVKSSDNKNALVTHEFIDAYERHMTSLKFKSFNHFIQTSFGLWRINMGEHRGGTQAHVPPCSAGN